MDTVGVDAVHPMNLFTLFQVGFAAQLYHARSG